MADVKISGLPASTTPLTGTEVLPVVQGGVTKQVSVDNLTAGKAVSATTMTLANNLAFSGTGNRITGDFSGSPITNRVGFQSSTTNGNTSFYVIPNGTAVLSAINFTNSSDITNASSVLLRINATAADLISTQIGTGTYLPLTIQTGGAERMRVSTAGDVSLATGNLVIGTSGKGIDFSATAGTGTSELLADYEEGTWTPAYTGFTFGGTTTTTNATYTKIGRCVYVTFSVSNTVSIACTYGVSFVTGLPFVINGASTSTSINENTGANVGVGLVYGAGNLLFLPTFTSGVAGQITTSFFYFV
jgi:hypothetical protein